ncbi:hypothetical protein GOODEAATRI_024517 [Goodea atripinnis]|uniref:Uncharacterized protein n=1 Tax=Goodea atripinnis TaxID=208336 RepID=A0ABV0NXF6_9TELE
MSHLPSNMTKRWSMLFISSVSGHNVMLETPISLLIRENGGILQQELEHFHDLTSDKQTASEVQKVVLSGFFMFRAEKVRTRRSGCERDDHRGSDIQESASKVPNLCEKTL